MREGARARYWQKLEDGRIQCDLCPRECKLHDGQRAFCFVRQRVGEELRLTTHGRSSGFCVDPIEKKPLNQFFPGSSVLSFGTAGCNLGCRFCQNWDISKARENDALADAASPEEIASRAAELGCKSVAFTYNDPVVFLEYALEVAQACRERGVKTVAVTAGYIHEQPRRELFGKMDAANVDLKAFTDHFYRRLAFASLAPVLETLEYVARETKVWMEITTLLIPGLNDSDEEVTKLSEWLVEHVGAEVPLHLSAFHPAFKLLEVPPTPPATLRRARELARRAGLRFVYTGNVHDAEGDTTFCPSCTSVLIRRDWYELLAYQLTADGRCPDCGVRVPGHYDPAPGRFGRRRIPLSFT
ncbi:MAG: AmmeMemoRadiSam system radical SAM enzyme [Myxococcales bacterium]|nr:AmmeMemoRadiSam system radical SAM enzyme [Myxococcales bacterium]